MGSSSSLFSPKKAFSEDILRNTLFPKSPKKPKAPPKVPEAADPEVERARAEQRLRAKRRLGRNRTILTSGLGDTTEPTLEKKTLLGG